MKSLAEYLDIAAQTHGHLCAGQVLGVRLAMHGLRELGIDDPIAERKRIVTYVEIDRCVTDAVALVANCRLGKRVLKFRDGGKVAATFVDLQTSRAVRIAARESSKQAAREMFPELAKGTGQQKAYAQLSDEVLFDKQWVKVEIQPKNISGFKGPRVVCAQCGEGINFKREVVKDGRTLCRACAGERYYVPIPCVALIFLLLSLGSLAYAQQAPAGNDGRPAACDKFDEVQVPASDLPTPEERKALASCSSESLYFGVDHPADPVKARKCAYIEREAGKGIPEVVFGAAGMLTMIYANGKGAARNFDLALKFACEFGDTSGKEDLRFEHLLKLKNENWTGDDFDLCDDQPGNAFWLRACLKPQLDKEQAVRTHKISAITKKWAAAEKTAFRELQKTATASFEASALNEVDQSEIGRSIDRASVETSLNDDFVAALQQFDAGQLPEFTALEFSKVDAELNSIYSKLQSDPKNKAYGDTTLTPENVKIAQRAWLRYREAWVKFGHLKYPSVTPESWRTWLTQERVEILKNLPRAFEP
jgi:formylmethanofuran dehydrogenase subunit E